MQEKLKLCPIVEMPDNFIPPIKTLKPTDEDETPCENRFQHLKCLDKRPKPLFGTPIKGVSQGEFETRLDALRQATDKWGNARIESFFAQELKRKVPGIQMNGGDTQSTNDFCDFIRKGPWDAKMRGIVAFASHKMWGDDNQWAINFEQEFKEMMRLEFSGIKSNGKTQSRQHKGKCASAIFVRA